MKMAVRSTKSSLTEIGPMTSSRPFRFLIRTIRLTSSAMTAARSPARARAPIATLSQFTQAGVPPASGVSAHPLSFSDGVCFLPSSIFSSPNFPIKSRSCIITRRLGSFVRSLSHLALQWSSGSHLIVCTPPLRPLQSLAIWSSLFLVVNWAVHTAITPEPILLIDKIFLYGVGSSN